MKKIILIILGFIITLGIGIIVGLNLPKQKINDNPKEETIKYTLTDLDEIIDGELRALRNKNNLQELTNQERLRILLVLHKGTGNKIDVKELRKVHKNSIIKNLNIEYTDIYDWYSEFSSDEQENTPILYKYDKQTDTYIYAEPGGHGSTYEANIDHKELITFEEENNTYTVRYKYVFSNFYDDYNLYYSGIDAYKEVNSFKKFENIALPASPEYDEHQAQIDAYIKDNYNTIKEKLPIYTYEFKVDNGQLIITSFNVEY